MHGISQPVWYPKSVVPVPDRVEAYPPRHGDIRSPFSSQQLPCCPLLHSPHPQGERLLHHLLVQGRWLMDSPAGRRGVRLVFQHTGAAGEVRGEGAEDSHPKRGVSKIFCGCPGLSSQNTQLQMLTPPPRSCGSDSEIKPQHLTVGHPWAALSVPEPRPGLRQSSADIQVNSGSFS